MPAFLACDSPNRILPVPTPSQSIARIAMQFLPATCNASRILPPQIHKPIIQ